MRRSNNLFNITLNEIEYIYNKQIRVNTKNKLKLMKFENYYSINITRVYNVFKTGIYNMGKYNIFLIREPKYRVIMSQNIYDKLVNHVFGNKLITALERSLIDTNIATRKNKGTSYGIKYLKKYLNELKGKHIYALKFDINKYFYSIDHKILKDMLKNKIKDKTFLKILFQIIDSTDYNYVNEQIKSIVDKEINRVNSFKLKEELQRIPLYKKGKGLPIGNLTSQILAIFYLNDLDHYIKEDLKCKYYIRYMDDGVILSNDKNYLKDCLNKIEKEIKKYKLNFNNKTKIVDVSKEGLDFLGYRFYVKNKVIMKVRNKTKKAFKRKMKVIRKKAFISLSDIEVINSYIGFLNWGNCYYLEKISPKIRRNKVKKTKGIDLDIGTKITIEDYFIE